MQQTSHRTYSFGDFALDLTTGCLRHEGEEVKLRPKAFKALRYLVENSNRLVSKDELVKAVWADAFVTDNSLVQCLKEVRAALQDEAHLLIKTVPRRGYIFVAEVNDTGLPDSGPVYAEQLEGIKIVIEEVEESEPATNHHAEAAEQLQPPPPLRQPSELRRGNSAFTKSRIIVGVLTLALLAGAVGSYRWANKNKASAKISIENIRLTKLTNTGDVYAPAISPNGQYLVYHWLKPAGACLRVQQMATGSSIEIAPPIPSHLQPTSNYWAATFSADSNYIYYILADGGENYLGTLFRVPVLGGHSQKILNHVSGGGLESPDGQRLVFVRANQIPGLSYLMTCNRDGTDEQILSTIDTNSMYVALDWSPDGKNLLYGFRQHTPEGYFHYLAEIPATGGNEYRITQPRRERIITAQWLPDKSGLIMNAIDPQKNLSQIYYVSYPGGEEQRITNDLNDYKGISIADDGRTVVTQLNGGTANLWLMPTSEPGHAIVLGSSTRGWYQGLSWTPDNELVYDCEEDGVRQICKMTADGSNHQQLTTGPGHKIDPSVTADGHFIVYFSTRSGSGQIWRMTANGDDPVQLTYSTVGVFKPQCSPDGQWVYYGADVRGHWQVWRVPITGGAEELVEAAPVQTWAISPDGKMLAYSFFDERNKKMRIAVRRLDAPEPFRYFDISSEIRLEWTKDGQALTYVDSESANKNIWLQPLDGGPARPLTALGADQWVVTYAWSPDGKMLAYTRLNTTFDAALLQLK